MTSDFVGYLQTDWFLKTSAVTIYINALDHLLDFRRSYNNLTKIHNSMFIPPKNTYSTSQMLPIQKDEIRLERSFKC